MRGGADGAMTVATLLVSHGTVQHLDELEAFATNIRRGRPAPRELVSELRRKYEAIGGSPLNAINAQVASKLERRLGVRVVWANRLWKPYARDVIATLSVQGVRRIALVPLAQYSAHVYGADAREAADAHGVELSCAPNWGDSPALCEAFASRIVSALPASSQADSTAVMMTAHSLPRSVLESGDPYERDVRAAGERIAAAVRARLRAHTGFFVAFQSQGVSAGDGRRAEWLGPDLPTTLDRAVERGYRHVLVAPIGFLADHVEILYDLDVEARAMAQGRGLTFARVPSLNSDDDLIDVLEGIARSLL